MAFRRIRPGTDRHRLSFHTLPRILVRILSGSFQDLFRIFSGSFQDLFRIFSGSFQDLSRIFSGSFQDLFRVVFRIIFRIIFRIVFRIFFRIFFSRSFQDFSGFSHFLSFSLIFFHDSSWVFTGFFWDFPKFLPRLFPGHFRGISRILQTYKHPKKMSLNGWNQPGEYRNQMNQTTNQIRPPPPPLSFSLFIFSLFSLSFSLLLLLLLINDSVVC